MAAPDLTTLANVKAWLGITSSTDDAQLSRLITAYSQYIQTWLNRQIAAQSYSELRDGSGKDFLVFADYPVTAVTSLKINGQAISQSADGVLQPGYAFDDGQIWLIGYRFAKGRKNIALTYTAGYATTPPELEQAVIEVIALRYKERERIGHQSKSLAGETVSFYIKDYPDSVQTILNNYRKVVPL